MTEKSLIAVWWVNQADCEAINESQVPAGYIRDTYEDRYGRAGRGRLWVPSKIKVQQVTVPKTVICEGQDTHGGVVLFKADIEKVRSLGGILSDADGNVL